MHHNPGDISVNVEGMPQYLQDMYMAHSKRHYPFHPYGQGNRYPITDEDKYKTFNSWPVPAESQVKPHVLHRRGRAVEYDNSREKTWKKPVTRFVSCFHLLPSRLTFSRNSR